MTYTTISPLGKRNGIGTFDDIYDTTKYSSHPEAMAANDLVIIDFVQDTYGKMYFQCYYSKEPAIVKILPLQIQNFIPALGVDGWDDQAAMNLAQTMFP